MFDWEPITNPPVQWTVFLHSLTQFQRHFIQNNYSYDVGISEKSHFQSEKNAFPNARRFDHIIWDWNVLVKGSSNETLKSESSKNAFALKSMYISDKHLA